jgi:hypothetical protein
MLLLTMYPDYIFFIIMIILFTDIQDMPIWPMLLMDFFWIFFINISNIVFRKSSVSHLNWFQIIRETILIGKEQSYQKHILSRNKCSNQGKR